MSVVIIPYDELLKSPVVPIQARTYVTDEQYVQIHQRFAAAVQAANQQACCLEGCIAIFLCFPCIFLLHPCNTSSFFNSHGQQACIDLNNQLFQGRQILTMGPSGLYISISNLDNYTTPTVAQNMYNNVPMATAVAGPRIMSVTIPENAAPGSTMTVLAPDNVTKVTVTVPENRTSGQVLQVEY